MKITKDDLEELLEIRKNLEIMKTQKITQSFVRDFFNNDFELSQDEENSRMHGNIPSDETAIKYWIRKNENEVRYILTDQEAKAKFNSNRMIKILTLAVNNILKEENGIDFLNSGYPVNFSIYKTNCVMNSIDFSNEVVISPKGLSSRLKTVQNRINWLNEFLNPLDLKIEIFALTREELKIES